MIHMVTTWRVELEQSQMEMFPNGDQMVAFPNGNLGRKSHYGDHLRTEIVPNGDVSKRRPNGCISKRRLGEEISL